MGYSDRAGDKNNINAIIIDALSAIDFARSLHQNHYVHDQIKIIQNQAKTARLNAIYDTTILILSFLDDQAKDMESLHNQTRLDHYLQTLRHYISIENKI